MTGEWQENIQYQYFIFKNKNEFLPEIIKESLINNKIRRYYYYDIMFISLKYFRKLKIQNIENIISEDEKALLEYLINTSFTLLITKEAANERGVVTSGYGGVSGSAGTSGVSGYAGISGCTTTSFTINPGITSFSSAFSTTTSNSIIPTHLISNKLKILISKILSYFRKKLLLNP